MVTVIWSRFRAFIAPLPEITCICLLPIPLLKLQGKQQSREVRFVLFTAAILAPSKVPDSRGAFQKYLWNKQINE